MDKIMRVMEAMDSMAKICNKPSGKNVVSTKHVPVTVREVNGGQQAIYRFANDYGASVVNSGMSYGGLELAVLKFNKQGDWRLTYETPVSGDVEGNLDQTRMDELLDQIAALER